MVKERGKSWVRKRGEVSEKGYVNEEHYLCILSILYIYSDVLERI